MVGGRLFQADGPLMHGGHDTGLIGSAPCNESGRNCSDESKRDNSRSNDPGKHMTPLVSQMLFRSLDDARPRTK